MDEYTWYIIGATYLIACICVAVEADARGHDGFTTFFFCVFCSPLIGAIMYSHYKQKKEVEPVEEPEVSIE